MANLTIPGRPVGKGRPRTTKTGHIYTPPKTENYEAYVRLLWIQEFGHDVMFPECAVGVQVFVNMAPPKSTSKKKRQDMLDHYIWPTKKPDADNVAKIVCDALNGLAYGDDKQIAALLVLKGYAEADAVEVRVDELLPAGVAEYARMRAGGYNE
jgi:Holliday junction resolvase RusA-like endonuclease